MSDEARHLMQRNGSVDFLAGEWARTKKRRESASMDGLAPVDGFVACSVTEQRLPQG